MKLRDKETEYKRNDKCPCDGGKKLINPWVFFNNLLVGFVTGLTLGLVSTSHGIDTDHPAYTTAWNVGTSAGWIAVFSVLFYLINSGIL